MTVTDTTDSGVMAVQEALGRAWLYGLLGRLFDDIPDSELMNLMIGGDAVRLAAIAREIGVSTDSAARIEAVSADDAVSLGVEFTTLFEAHGRIYPFASCWTGEKPRLMRKPWAMANAFYQRLGLGLSEERLPRADHVGTELSFLSVLAAREAEARGTDDVAAASVEFERFLAVHVLTWVPEFCAKVRADTRADFYAVLAETLQAVLAIEAPDNGNEPAVVSTDTSKEVGL